MGNLLSDGVLDLSPVDGQMEATIDALTSHQECGPNVARHWMRLIDTLILMDSQVPLYRLHQRLIQLSFRDCWD